MHVHPRIGAGWHAPGGHHVPSLEVDVLDVRWHGDHVVSGHPGEVVHEYLQVSSVELGFAGWQAAEAL